MIRINKLINVKSLLSSSPLVLTTGMYYNNMAYKQFLIKKNYKR